MGIIWELFKHLRNLNKTPANRGKSHFRSATEGHGPVNRETSAQYAGSRCALAREITEDG
jgi:hypothetical protein